MVKWLRRSTANLEFRVRLPVRTLPHFGGVFTLTGVDMAVHETELLLQSSDRTFTIDLVLSDTEIDHVADMLLDGAVIKEFRRIKQSKELIWSRP